MVMHAQSDGRDLCVHQRTLFSELVDASVYIVGHVFAHSATLCVQRRVLARLEPDGNVRDRSDAAAARVATDNLSNMATAATDAQLALTALRGKNRAVSD